MATTLTPTYPEFCFLFAAIRRTALTATRACCARRILSTTPAACWPVITCCPLPVVCRLRRQHEHPGRPLLPRHPLPNPHADFLRLQHAHATGVLFLDLLDTLDLGGQRPDAVQQASFALVIALLTDQLGHVVNTCEPKSLPAWRPPPHEYLILFTD